ncbi:MAG: hypothetical protein ABL907_11655 [Hyphomicrobium sp.]
MTPERKEAVKKLGELKQAFSTPHPGITDAFDLAEAALIKAMDGSGELTVRDLTKQMLKAVMDAGFMIMHRDEIQDTIIAVAQAGKILHSIPPQPKL